MNQGTPGGCFGENKYRDTVTLKLNRAYHNLGLPNTAYKQ
jgi:hypothetical protein